MGLVKEEEKFVVLSDILGDEDHLGDVDLQSGGLTREEKSPHFKWISKLEGITPVNYANCIKTEAKGAPYAHSWRNGTSNPAPAVQIFLTTRHVFTIHEN